MKKIIQQLLCKHENIIGWFIGMTHYNCHKCGKRAKIK